ncbi:hypothetical protein WAI453_011147 [Rhynchosporium graminicola]
MASCVDITTVPNVPGAFNLERRLRIWTKRFIISNCISSPTPNSALADDPKHFGPIGMLFTFKREPRKNAWRAESNDFLDVTYQSTRVIGVLTRYPYHFSV